MKEDYLMMPLKDKLQLLGRMKSDCEYYLGEGRKQITHLWGGTVDNQIRSMQELLSSILQEYRPEWLTLEDIRRFSDAMDHRQVITAETLGLSVPGSSLLSRAASRNPGARTRSSLRSRNVPTRKKMGRRFSMLLAGNRATLP